MTKQPIALIATGLVFLFLLITTIAPFTLTTEEAKSKVKVTLVDAEIDEENIIIMFSTETKNTGAFDRKIDYDQDFIYPTSQAINCIKEKGKTKCLDEIKQLIKKHKESLINTEAQRIITEQEKNKTTEKLTITKEELMNIAKD